MTGVEGTDRGVRAVDPSMFDDGETVTARAAQSARTGVTGVDAADAARANAAPVRGVRRGSGLVKGLGLGAVGVSALAMVGAPMVSNLLRGGRLPEFSVTVAVVMAVVACVVTGVVHLAGGGASSVRGWVSSAFIGIATTLGLVVVALVVTMMVG